MKPLLGSVVSRPQPLGKRRLSVLGAGVLVVLSTKGPFPGSLTPDNSRSFNGVLGLAGA